MHLLHVFHIDNSFVCEDTEVWCKYEPNCAKEDVQAKCPKFCKICKGIIITYLQNSKYIAANML